MQNTRMKNCLNRIETFTTGKLYVAAASILALFFHVVALDVIGLCLFSLITLLCLIFFEDIRSALPTATTLILIVSTQNSPGYGKGENYYALPQNYIPLLICAVLVFAAAIYRIIKYRKDIKPSALLLSLIIFSCSLLIAGAFKKFYLQSLIFGVAIAVFYLLLYLLLYTGVKPRADNVDYIATLFTAISLVIAAEVFFVYFLKVASGESFDVNFKQQIITGWGVSNVAGELLVMCVPMIMYKVHGKYSKWYLLSAMVCMTALMFTLNRTGIMIGIPMFIGFFVYKVIKSGHKKQLIATASVYVLSIIAVISLIMCFTSLKEILQYFNYAFDFSKDFSSGRFGLWKKAVIDFAHNFIVGIGFAFNYYTGEYLEKGTIFSSLCHNVVFQMLSSGGIIGLTALINHLISELSLFKGKFEGKKYFFLSIAVFWAVSLLDIVYFIPYCILYYVLLTVYVEKTKEFTGDENGKKTESCNSLC